MDIFGFVNQIDHDGAERRGSFFLTLREEEAKDEQFRERR